MKIISLMGMLLIGIVGFSQNTSEEKDFSLARVGIKQQGCYIFMGVEPFYKYTYVATLKVTVDFYNQSKTIDKLIKKAKKKYPYFNGIIIYGNKKGKADLIQFKEEEMTRGGFVLGQKVTFMKRINTIKTFFDGVIVDLELGNEKAAIEYINAAGDKKIEKVFYGDINPAAE